MNYLESPAAGVLHPHDRDRRGAAQPEGDPQELPGRGLQDLLREASRPRTEDRQVSEPLLAAETPRDLTRTILTRIHLILLTRTVMIIVNFCLCFR